MDALDYPPHVRKVMEFYFNQNPSVSIHQGIYSKQHACEQAISRIPSTPDNHRTCEC